MDIVSLLQKYLEDNIIQNEDSAFENDMKSIKEMHPYAITPPKTEGGRWQTYYRKPDGKRCILRASNENELWKKLLSIYMPEKYDDKFTFYKLYQKWLEYKETITDSPNTILRHKQHYKKYFATSKLHDMPVRKITELVLESECNLIVKKHNLSSKEWVNVKTILRGMYEYAYRNKLIKENTIENIKIRVRFRQVTKKSGKTQTYNPDELKNLFLYLDQKYVETENTMYLAVKMNFFLGLRVGELVALRWEDYDEESHTLHIVREEIKNRVTNVYSVVEHTKTFSDRTVVVPPQAAQVLSLIPRDCGFIFGEITSRHINYVLEKYAERNGLQTKSSHKMRKTYASNLASHGVPLDAIREQLGHTDLKTTLGYIYNPLTEKQTYDLISQAF